MLHQPRAAFARLRCALHRHLSIATDSAGLTSPASPAGADEPHDASLIIEGKPEYEATMGFPDAMCRSTCSATGRNSTFDGWTDKYNRSLDANSVGTYLWVPSQGRSGSGRWPYSLQKDSPSRHHPPRRSAAQTPAPRAPNRAHSMSVCSAFWAPDCPGVGDPIPPWPSSAM